MAGSVEKENVRFPNKRFRAEATSNFEGEGERDDVTTFEGIYLLASCAGFASCLWGAGAESRWDEASWASPDASEECFGRLTRDGVAASSVW